MADLSVFGKFRTKQDYDMAAEEFALRKQALLSQANGQSPAAVKLANELQQARASGDTQRLNDLVLSAKLADRGVVFDAQGNPVEMSGYGTAIGGIEATKKGMSKQAEQNVNLQMLPQIEAAKTGAKIGAETQANAQAAYPKVEAQADETLSDIEKLRGHKGLGAIVGAKNIFQGAIPFSEKVVEGSPAAGAKALLDKIKGGTFLQAVQNLKGSGQITEIEGQKAQSAIARLSQAQSEKDFNSALKDYEDVIKLGQSRANAIAYGLPQGAMDTLNNATGGANIPTNMPPQLPLGKYEQAKQKFDKKKNYISLTLSLSLCPLRGT